MQLQQKRNKLGNGISLQNPKTNNDANGKPKFRRKKRRHLEVVAGLWRYA